MYYISDKSYNTFAHHPSLVLSHGPVLPLKTHTNFTGGNSVHHFVLVLFTLPPLRPTRFQRDISSVESDLLFRIPSPTWVPGYPGLRLPPFTVSGPPFDLHLTSYVLPVSLVGTMNVETWVRCCGLSSDYDGFSSTLMAKKIYLDVQIFFTVNQSKKEFVTFSTKFDITIQNEN